MSTVKSNCLTTREKVIRYASKLEKPATSSEIAKAIGGRGVTSGRVAGWLNGSDVVVFIPAKTIKTGPNAGKRSGSGKWVRKVTEDGA